MRETIKILLVDDMPANLVAMEALISNLAQTVRRGFYFPAFDLGRDFESLAVDFAGVEQGVIKGA